jgi:two-component system, LuxR family, response regulator FixJ
MAKEKRRVTVYLVIRRAEERTELRDHLATAGMNVSEYMTGREFLLDQSVSPGGILVAEFQMLDMMFPDLLDAMRTKRVDLPSLAITGYIALPDAVRSCPNVIAKPFQLDDMADEIRFILDGASYSPDELRAAFASLPPRLIKIADELATGISSRELAAKLEISAKTVEAQRARIMAKSRARDVGELVRMWKQWREIS